MKKTVTLLLTILVFGYTNAQVTVTTFAGSTQGFADGTGAAAQFYLPNGVATDTAGNVYVADTHNNKIRKITPEGVVSTIAGSGVNGYANGTGTAAQFNLPSGVAADGIGNVYVADQQNHRIRKISPAGVVTTFAGSSQGYADGIATVARFSTPVGVATDAAGNVYVADYYNNKIRKITSAGVVSTLAGSTQGYADGTGTAAQFYNPSGVALDAAGNVYVADYNNNRIRKITPAGIVSTFAGSGIAVGSLDGIGTAAMFYYPNGVATDGVGNVYVADFNNNEIRKITPEAVVSTLAGNGNSGATDGIGALAQFKYPTGVATDAAGNVYISDTSNHRIRKIAQTLGVTQNDIPSKITIYPNPVAKLLTVQLENDCVLDKISIADLSGKIILTQSQNSNTINVENLAQGIYILEAYSGEDKYVSKFVKE
jgi:sugar lactone lactonase YvrE